MKKRNAKDLRTERLIQYFVENHRSAVGDRLLSLPRYVYPIDQVQCYLRDSAPSYYYLTLSGSVVGLSIDPAFVPEAKTPMDAKDAADATQWTLNVPIPRAQKCPKLLSRLPVCATVGLGIVRSVDLRRNRIVVLSPLAKQDMARVNTLVISASPVPPELLSSVRYR